MYPLKDPLGSERVIFWPPSMFKKFRLQYEAKIMTYIHCHNIQLWNQNMVICTQSQTLSDPRGSFSGPPHKILNTYIHDWPTNTSKLLNHKTRILSWWPPSQTLSDPRGSFSGPPSHFHASNSSTVKKACLLIHTNSLTSHQNMAYPHIQNLNFQTIIWSKGLYFQTLSWDVHFLPPPLTQFKFSLHKKISVHTQK
jgi:hypothetical protein